MLFHIAVSASDENTATKPARIVGWILFCIHISPFLDNERNGGVDKETRITDRYRKKQKVEMDDEKKIRAFY